MAICQLTTEERERAKRDEITSYLLARYLGPHEGAQIIFGLEIHSRSPPVVQLCVHLPGENRVFFTERTAALQAVQPQRSTLTAFFDLCHRDEFARTLLYMEIPRFFVWHADKKEWQRAKIGPPVQGHAGVRHRECIGRMYTVSPRAGDVFYLRLALLRVRGPVSYLSLRTVDGHLYPSFRETCRALGMLEDDRHWRLCMDEAVETQMPAALRCLFSIILVHGDPTDIPDLWRRFRLAMGEDFAHRESADEAWVDNRVLGDLAVRLAAMGGSSLSQLGLPEPCAPQEVESPFDTNQLLSFVEEREQQLTHEQGAVYQAVLESLNGTEGGMHFIDAAGGTGKSFLLELLLAYVRSRGEIALAVASTGIAATLLPGGQTAHSAFKIPLTMQQGNSFCSIGKQSDLAEKLRRTRLIVWDEAAMMHRRNLETVERSLRDIVSDRPFGGLTVVLAGDFRQLLAVIKGGTAANTIDACINKSALWSEFRQHRLTRNLRLHAEYNSEALLYAEFLLQVSFAFRFGNGLNC